MTKRNVAPCNFCDYQPDTDAFFAGSQHEMFRCADCGTVLCARCADSGIFAKAKCLACMKATGKSKGDMRKIWP